MAYKEWTLAFFYILSFSFVDGSGTQHGCIVYSLLSQRLFFFQALWLLIEHMASWADDKQGVCDYLNFIFFLSM